MKKFRLIRSGPGSAAFNMGQDQELFNRFLKDGIPVLRVYRWEAPSFTYGVSQHPESELDVRACIDDGIQIAQRITGGGILFHHNDMTYSFACSKDDVGEPAGVFVSYREICVFLINFYRSLGLQASFAVDALGFCGKSSPHEFCCASYEKYDIVINGRKIGGNAQKRNRQAILQHGSIPLTIDWGFVRRHARSLPAGISSSVTTLSRELSVVPDMETLENKLIEAFSNTFGTSYETCLAQ